MNILLLLLLPTIFVAFISAQTPSANETAAFLCDACLEIIAKVRANVPKSSVVAFAEGACSASSLLSSQTCDRLISTYDDEIFNVISNLPYNASQICSGLLSNCGGVNSSNSPLNSQWKVSIPGKKPKVKPWPKTSKHAKTLRVLHLSDIHIDYQYAIGSEADCGVETIGTTIFNLCCRNDSSSQQNGTKVKQPAGKWGSISNCDIPLRTFESALRHIRKHEKLDYIIVTGDLISHDYWNYARNRTIADINKIIALFRKYFPKTKVFDAVGNHEGVPPDAFAPHSLPDYKTIGPSWLYNKLANDWRMWLPNGTRKPIKYRGSYATCPYKGLKIISLNTNYCSVFNFYLYVNETDPDGTLQWLVNELKDSEKIGQKVHIISHTPPGITYCMKTWSKNYYDIVNRFENTIVAQFFGHTHNDQFEVYYENSKPNGRPTNFNFIVPSMTTFPFLQPAYRIYTIDRETFTAIDAETYTTDLNAANKNDEEPKWRLEYKMKETYGMSDLCPASWNSLIGRLEKNKKLLGKFIKFYYRDNVTQCDSSCQTELICGLKSAKSYSETNFCS